ncbi:broad-spectrum mercury transporter MerE [Escherichia coli]
MNSPEHLPSETHKPITGYLWGALAVLTCPCHLPILAIVLAGTTAGAFIGEHWGRGLTLSGTKTHVKQRFLPLTPLLMVSDVLWSPVLPA